MEYLFFNTRGNKDVSAAVQKMLFAQGCEWPDQENEEPLHTEKNHLLLGVSGDEKGIRYADSLSRTRDRDDQNGITRTEVNIDWMFPPERSQADKDFDKLIESIKGDIFGSKKAKEIRIALRRIQENGEADYKGGKELGSAFTWSRTHHEVELYWLNVHDALYETVVINGKVYNQASVARRIKDLEVVK